MSTARLRQKRRKRLSCSTGLFARIYELGDGPVDCEVYELGDGPVAYALLRQRACYEDMDKPKYGDMCRVVGVEKPFQGAASPAIVCAYKGNRRRASCERVEKRGQSGNAR